METRLIYNATEKLYELRLGLRTLSSHETKEQALTMQLENEAPAALELARKLIQAHPELEGRAIKAVVLFAQNAVNDSTDPMKFTVHSQEKPGSKPAEVYQVDADASTCTCRDWENGAPVVNGRKLCKHILAALFARRLGTNRQGIGIPRRSERLCHEKRP